MGAGADPLRCFHRGGGGDKVYASPSTCFRRDADALWVQSQGGRSNPPAAPIPRHHHHNHQALSHSVPQFAEEDYCPICHRALPYLHDPSDAGREAHIASCITAATSPPPPFSAAIGRTRSYTNGGRMVVWNAGLKDCRDPITGELVECVICFEEFEVGCEIARLECLCRYHKVR